MDEYPPRSASPKRGSQQNASEYWIVKSDPAIHRAGQDLTIKILADSVRIEQRRLVCQVSTDYAWSGNGRLFASVVGYREQSDSLWKHPEWVTRVYAPRWIEVDTLQSDALEFTVPGFGDSTKAVLVVLSLAAGRDQKFVLDTSYYMELFTYRLQLGVRTAPFQSTNPLPIAGEASIREEQPAFSPDGALVAYTETQGSNPSQIYVRAADGSGRTLLHANSISPGQSRADWSPRGDWVVYEDYQANWPYPDIHLFNRTTSEHRLLTPGLDATDEQPAFSPNGQRISYVSHLLGAGGDPTENWVLRRIDLGGANMTTLTLSSNARPLRSPRWSPDGKWVYFLAGDSLYAVGAEGAQLGQVVTRASVLAKAQNFDLHRGRGRLCFEELVTPKFLRWCYDPLIFMGDSSMLTTTPYRRIATRDTLHRLPLNQFLKRGGANFSPRWSFDGTRIAYSSNEANFSTARDLFIGQVSWNHAPKFNDAPRDTVIPSACTSQPFVQYFSAVDPDGEAMTYEAAYLPSGATLTASGEFTWPNPVATPGDHYVVFRVLDGSGGLDQRVVKFTVESDPHEPNPVSDLFATVGKTSAMVNWTDTGEDWLVGTSCYTRVRYTSSGVITEQNFFTGSDTLIAGMPGPPGTINCAEVFGLQPCTWYSFALKTRDDAGNWSPLSNMVVAKTRCSGSSAVACTWESGGMMAANSPGGRMTAQESGLMTVVQSGGAGGGWSIENDVLRNAIPGSLTLDRHHLKRISSAGGGARVRISRNGSAPVSLDAVDLSYVDHVPGQSLFLDGDQVIAGTLASAEAVLDDKDQDIGGDLAHGDDVTTVPAGTTWTIDLGSGSGERGYFLEVAGGPTIGPIGVELETSPGVWEARAERTPRWTFDPIVIPAEGSSRARVTFTDETEVRQVAAIAVAGTPSRQGLSISSALHSRLGSVTEALYAEGGSEALLEPREHVVVEFDDSVVAEGQVRDYFLGTRGRRATPGESSMRAGRRGEAEVLATTTSPVSFALHQAEPTPFSNTTRIRFDLPRPVWVHLEVFDLQGRRVASLADEFLAPGEYAREWNGQMAAGGRAPHGVYLYRLRAGEMMDQRKLVLMP